MAFPVPPTTSGPFPGTAPETMDDLRQECSMLRQRVASLESENNELSAMMKEWRRWYSQQYRPHIEYLDGEVSRLCSLAPMSKPGSPMQTGLMPPEGFASMTSSLSGPRTPLRAPPTAGPPPGMRRCHSETGGRGGKRPLRRTPPSTSGSTGMGTTFGQLPPLSTQ
eukprot:TRINITY_DN20731_c0_g1_i1.p1 TRINITY_DN20731_c0_g1~~TRINITY_DN20731_c0_g1_i1.p1  ORF type:complete len:166 (+),score=16.17 TRINITY_DN20731_c0_g1_i1:56-553(+)